MRTYEEEVGNGFADSVFAVRAFWGVEFLHSVEDCVERDVSRSELYEETGLVAAQLVYDVKEVIGGE